MAPAVLTTGALPGEPQLRAFAHVAAPLLIDRLPRAPGAQGLARRPGVGLQHLDHRDYVPGDEVRHIDWRQTARQRRPIVRQFEAESMSDWHLVLDGSSSMGAHWASAVGMAAGLAYALLGVGHRVGLVICGARVLAQVPRGRGPRQYAALARLLSRRQPPARGERCELGAATRQLHGATTVVVFSDFLADGPMHRELGAWRQRGADVHALQLRAEADTRIDLRGELDLVDAESGRTQPVWVDDAAGDLARAARTSATARLHEFCARSGAAFSDWDTAQPWQQTLLTHLVRARRLG
jgi:uncharacterized protein (DUF58 family)